MAGKVAFANGFFNDYVHLPIMSGRGENVPRIFALLSNKSKKAFLSS
jgi:hypothetical protein